MAPLYLLLFFLLFSAFSTADRITTVVVPLSKDSATLQYIVEVQQGTPFNKKRLVVDLSGDFLWLHCKSSAYKSSTYLPIPCHTPLCTASGSVTFGCGDCSNVPPGTKSCRNNTCLEQATNGVTGTQIFNAELSQDVVALSPSDGKRAFPASKVIVAQFAFACAPSTLLCGLAKGAVGMAGLNWAPLALPFQLNVALELERKFGLCLPAGNSSGAVFFGAPPYLPSIKLNYTFLLIPKYPREYYLNVNSIQVNGKRLPMIQST
ncbi:hypothetical protein SUGI_0109760 [Cryptomeria japonica]|nr:hypothetical protein SUGI_0109760 [Cryptomeria japonica]